MKRFKSSILVMVFAFLTVTACKKEKESVEAVEKSITDGKWVVSYYYDKTKDETSDFSGYTFEFRDNGDLVAEKGGSSTFGTWVIHEESNDDSSDDHTEMVINLGPDEPLEELNDDWHIVENKNNTIKLEGESGSGGIEKLHFKKQ